MVRIIRGKDNELSIVRLIIVFGAIAFLLLSALQSVAIINAGTRGVLLNLGRPAGILQEGLNWKAPWVTDVAILPVNVRALSSDESTGTSEQLEVITSITINYRLNPLFVDDIWTQLSQDYEERIIKPFMKEALKQTTAKFSAEAFLTQRDQLSNTFFTTLRDKLEPYHIQLITVSITNYEYPQAYDERVTAKLTEAQRELEAQNILNRIRIEAQQQVIQAEAQATATIATATADANAMLIKATAEAEAVRLIQEQLAQNPEYLQYFAIEVWDGKLPNFFMGDTIPFLNIDTLQEP